MKKSRLLGAVFALISSFLVFGVSTNLYAAAISYYQGSVFNSGINSTANFLISTNGIPHTYSEGYTTNVGVGLDTGASELWYTDYALSAESYTTSFTDDFTVGFGEVVSITTTLNVNAVQSGLTGPTENLALTPLTGGLYAVEYPTATNLREPVVFSGDYSVTGPTENATGTFSITLFGSKSIVGNNLDTATYPDSLTLVSTGGISHFLFMPSTPEMIYSGTIDGIDYASTISQVNFASMQGISLFPTAVPIPATVWLFGSGLLGLVGMARKKA